MSLPKNLHYFILKIVCNKYEMSYQELLDIGGRFLTHKKLIYCLSSLSKTINISDPDFVKVLYAKRKFIIVRKTVND